MDFSRKSRTELIDEIVAIVTGGLAFRSDYEVESILEAMKDGTGDPTGESGIKSADQSVMISINPSAGKDATVAALGELAKKVDENWEELTETSTPIEEIVLPGPDQGNGGALLN